MNSRGGSPNHVVVLAGGLGTRIRDSLGDTPKALAEIAGVPLVDRKLEEFSRNGLTSATFLLSHGSNEIGMYLASKSRSLHISIITDGPSLLGTGGALLHALPHLPSDFYLTYGDSLLEFNYSLLQEARQNANVRCSLAVTARVGEADLKNSCYENGKITRHDKRHQTHMNTTDYGVMLLNQAALESVADDLGSPLDLSVILGLLAEAGDLAGVLTNDKYWEIGTPQTLARVREHFDHV